MKKSIAFLGALLFGSVTFGQVTKNDSIKKPSSRKVSADDMKKFPEDSENSSVDGNIKQESTHTNLKFYRPSKQSSDASAGTTSSVIQKGRENKILVRTPEKQTSDNTANPISNFKGGAIQKANADKSAIKTTEKMHYTVKMTNASKNETVGSTDGQVLVDSTATQSTKASDVFIKIGDIKGE